MKKDARKIINVRVAKLIKGNQLFISFIFISLALLLLLFFLVPILGFFQNKQNITEIYEFLMVTKIIYPDESLQYNIMLHNTQVVYLDDSKNKSFVSKVNHIIIIIPK